jgi:hypothetical protein
LTRPSDLNTRHCSEFLQWLLLRWGRLLQHSSHSGCFFGHYSIFLTGIQGKTQGFILLDPRATDPSAAGVYATLFRANVTALAQTNL